MYVFEYLYDVCIYVITPSVKESSEGRYIYIYTSRHIYIYICIYSYGCIYMSIYRYECADIYIDMDIYKYMYLNIYMMFVYM
jgi:hypothetical protein